MSNTKTMDKPEALFAKAVAGSKLIKLPTIRDINESEALAPLYGAVLTVGPNPYEVEWNHPNHRVWTFGDQIGGLHAPKIEQIEEAITWGAAQDELLVHCHAGISRSTASAWGVSIMKGADPVDALHVLYENHPLEHWPANATLFKMSKWQKRPFAPNTLIVTHIEKILGFQDCELNDILRDSGIRSYF